MVSNLWKCSDHAHTRAKNRAVAEFQRLSLTNMRFLEDRMVALKTGQGRENLWLESGWGDWSKKSKPLEKVIPKSLKIHFFNFCRVVDRGQNT